MPPAPRYTIATPILRRSRGGNIDDSFLDQVPSKGGLPTTHRPSFGGVSLSELRQDQVDAPAAESGTTAAGVVYPRTSLNRESFTRVPMLHELLPVLCKSWPLRWDYHSTFC